MMDTRARRGLICSVFVGCALAPGSGVWMQAQSAPAKPQMTVYKDASCGCCLNWVEHLRKNGFEVKAIDVPDIDQVKRTYGVPPAAASCHTGLVNGYVVEGHVPADAILK